jgi:hypothetical protein
MLRKNMSRFLELLGALPLLLSTENLIIRIFMESGLLVEGWSNVSVHCATVATITARLGQLVGMEDAEVETLAIAGLIHDARKAREKIRAEQLVAEGAKQKGAAFAEAAEEQTEWLKAFGDELAEPIRISALSGHTSLAYFLGPDRPFSEKIFHLADDLCGGQWGDEVVMLSERIAQLGQRYEWLSSELPAELGGKSWLEAQEQVSRSILDELASRTVYRTGERLNTWLVRFS